MTTEVDNFLDKHFIEIDPVLITQNPQEYTHAQHHNGKWYIPESCDTLSNIIEIIHNKKSNYESKISEYKQLLCRYMDKSFC